MANCIDEGRLLLYLDNQLPPDQYKEIRSHLESCDRCTRRLKETEDNLRFSLDKLGRLWEQAGEAGINGQERVWNNISLQVKKRKGGRLGMKVKKWSVAAVIILVVGLAAYVPSFREAAADFLQVFRVEKVQSLTLSPQDMNQIEQALQTGDKNLNIENFGVIKSSGESEQHQIQADQVAQLPFSARLPVDAGTETTYSLGRIPDMEITPQVEAVNQWLSSLGSKDLLPEELQGQTFRIKSEQYLMVRNPVYSLEVTPAPQVEVPSGVDVKVLTRALINIPIWPEHFKAQLQAINDWEHTLVVPGEKSETVDVNGNSGVLVENNHSQTLVWQEDGLLYILDKENGQNADLLEIARSLK